MKQLVNPEKFIYPNKYKKNYFIYTAELKKFPFSKKAGFYYLYPEN